MPAPAPSTDVAVGQRLSARRALGPARMLAAIGLAGTLVAALVIGALHLLPQTAGISPVTRTISEYALTDVRWLFTLAVSSLSAGSLAILAASVLAGLARPGSLGILLGALWSVALVAVVLFPKHSWAVGPSTTSQIHRAASGVAFVCLPVAVLLLTRRRARQTPASIAARCAAGLAVLSLSWFAVILGAMALSPHSSTPWWQAIPLGLVERGLLLSEVLAVAFLAVWVLSATRRRRPATPAPSGPAP